MLSDTNLMVVINKTALIILVFLTSISNKYFTQPYPVESFALLEPI